MVYSTSGNRLKADFMVAPGADPSVIRLRYDGVGQARLEADGVLVLEGAAGELRENAPVIYQDLEVQRVKVEGSFRLLPDGTVGSAWAFLIPPFRWGLIPCSLTAHI